MSFRGTQTKQDWHTNFQAALIHPANTDKNLLVHSGFYNAFEILADGANGLGAKLLEIKTTTSGVPIYITGHSLGGALAQIAAAVLGDDRVAACYTFGSPRVGNSYFDLWVKVPSYRVINFADIVPQVPLPIIYRHSGDPRYLPDPVTTSPYRYQPNFLTRSRQFAQGVVQFIKAGGSILGIADHSIAEYSSKLDKIADVRAQSR
ncbi:MAG: lipase family protein [Methylocella sp.]